MGVPTRRSRAGAAPNAALCAWMIEAGFSCPMADVDWPTYNRSTIPPESRADWEAAMDAFFQTRTKAQVAARREINATVANEPGDVLADPHLLARQLFAQAGDIVAPKAFIRAGDLSVGQPLPQSYSVYNVPFAYRDRYYDTPDAWYRYNDGYIYRVDPTTRLVTAVIDAII